MAKVVFASALYEAGN